MSKSTSKRFSEENAEAMVSDLSGSAFFHPPLVDKPTSIQVDKPTKPQIEKYTTHLRPETIKAIRVYAAQHDMKDYEVAQLAFDRLLQGSEE